MLKERYKIVDATAIVADVTTLNTMNLIGIADDGEGNREALGIRKIVEREFREAKKRHG